MDNDYYDFIDHSFDFKPKKRGQRYNILALTDQEIVQREKLKLVRNRESAKNSRKRKKIYVDLLEGKVNALTSQLQEYQQLQAQNQEFLKGLQMKYLQKHDKQQRKLHTLDTENPTEKAEQLQHFVKEIYEQSVPSLAAVLSTDPDLPNEQRANIKSQIDTFRNNFEEIEDVKQQMSSELHQFHETLSSLQNLDPQNYQKFLQHINKADQAMQFKPLIDEIDEELFGIFKDQDMQINVSKVHDLYNLSLQFIKRPKLA